jgi:hypothetical protein
VVAHTLGRRVRTAPSANECRAGGLVGEMLPVIGQIWPTAGQMRPTVGQVLPMQDKADRR